ncbi:hypothetical protein QBC39DRAFT_345707 [Podospora conica]|nr:hypothetical protein QBC39DRAFT_345707 [Schizothecium conicum]
MEPGGSEAKIPSPESFMGSQSFGQPSGDRRIPLEAATSTSGQSQPSNIDIPRGEGGFPTPPIVNVGQQGQLTVGTKALRQGQAACESLYAIQKLPTSTTDTKKKKKKKLPPQQNINRIWKRFSNKALSVLPFDPVLPPTISEQSNELLIAGYERAAEECRRKVKMMIQEGKRVNMRYRDPDWDVDWDLTMGKEDSSRLDKRSAEAKKGVTEDGGILGSTNSQKWAFTKLERTKTEDEKEHRHVERLLRNLRAAQASRERKRHEVEMLERSNKELLGSLDHLHSATQDPNGKTGAWINNTDGGRVANGGGTWTDNLERGAGVHGSVEWDKPVIGATSSVGDRPKNQPTTRDDTGWHNKLLRFSTARVNTKAIRLLAFSSLALSVAANEDHHRAAKIATTAVSAFVSFGTGMTSLQLEIDSSTAGTRVAKMCLRIFSSTFLLALIGCFMHWFCAGAERTKRFISAAFGVLFLGWVLTRVVAAPSAGGVNDAFSWLDSVNLVGLLAAVAGIINVRTDGMLQQEAGSVASANPLLPLHQNGGVGDSQPQQEGEGSGDT